jgi:dipicolinate synthase subunit A
MHIDGSFGVLGGDRRQIAMVESIAADGYAVSVYGFDNVSFSDGVIKSGLTETVKNHENIILPLPVTSDGVHLKMDFSCIYSKR